MLLASKIATRGITDSSFLPPKIQEAIQNVAGVASALAEGSIAEFEEWFGIKKAASDFARAKASAALLEGHVQQQNQESLVALLLASSDGNSLKQAYKKLKQGIEKNLDYIRAAAIKDINSRGGFDEEGAIREGFDDLGPFVALLLGGGYKFRMAEDSSLISSMGNELGRDPQKLLDSISQVVAASGNGKGAL